MGLNRKKPLKQKTPLKSKSGIKRSSGLAKRSKKMEEKYIDRRKFVKKILSERPYCEACGVFATYDGKSVFWREQSVDVHELIRRSQGGSILDEKNVLAVCRPCHTRIGNEPELSFRLGLAKHSWERDTPEP